MQFSSDQFGVQIQLYLLCWDTFFNNEKAEHLIIQCHIGKNTSWKKQNPDDLHTKVKHLFGRKALGPQHVFRAIA